MSYKAHIRNNATGEVRTKDYDFEWDEGSFYWWSAGNFSCDCNREWEFQRAGNEPESEDPPCGETMYRVPKIELQDGTIVEIDRE